MSAVFQRIVDLSSSAPFYMLIVTHDAMHIFPDGDKEFGKIKGRFIDPICEISLPDNIAFVQLLRCVRTSGGNLP